MQPFSVMNPDAPPGLLLLCDHASNTIPPEYAGLGIAADDLGRHVAYDVGAADVTERLAEIFNAPAVLGCYSRLFIDLNRGLDDPTLIMRISDGAVIPGNHPMPAEEVRHRIETYYKPYHAAINVQIARAKASGVMPVLISIHSFTARMRKGPSRPWDVTSLFAADERVGMAMLRYWREHHPEWCVAANEPYSGALGGDTLDQHALSAGLPHGLIELRNDLISTQEEARRWAEALAPSIQAAMDHRHL